MRFTKLAATTLAIATAFSGPLLADGLTDIITVEDAYARSSGMSAKAGAAFMTIKNAGDLDLTIVRAESEAAKKVELHTHISGDNGVMQMREIEGGIKLPAGGEHVLERGADHIMFMGLNGPFKDGETISVTLFFEPEGNLTLDIPVDLNK